MMKYSQHDRVVYNKRKGKVLTGWVSMNGKPKYAIMLDDGTRIETTEDKLEMTEDPWELDELPRSVYNRPDTHCPRCGEKWKVVKFLNNVWKDCTYCKKTKEQIMKEEKENTPPPFPFMLGEDFMD
jgi:hypothetical protein